MPISANQSELFEVRDAAIQVAAAHADSVDPLWSTSALDFLLKFMAANPGRTFLAEEVRAFAYERGLPTPPDLRAWGGVLQKASKSGLIAPAGFTTSKNRQAHMRPTQMWRAA
jgi:hypothetical protein